MPSPPGARRRCRARSYAGLASTQGTRPSAAGKAECLPSNPSLARGPWGGKASCLPSRRKARSGQHPPQQKEGTPVGVPGRQDAFPPRARPRGRKSDSPPGGCAAETPRQGSASGHAQRRALGARASCPRYAPQGALVRRWIGPCAPDGASEGKMPSPPGARRRCRARSCAGLASTQGTRPSAVGKAVPSLQPATCSRRGPWGGRHLAFHRAARRVPAGTQCGKRKARLSACREGKMPSPPGPVHAEGSPTARQEAAPQKRRARGLRAAMRSDGPWGRGHLALAMRRKAHLVRRRIGPCAPVGASEGKMPSPPGARRRCRARSCADLASSQETRPSAGGKAVPSLQPATCSRRGPWGGRHLAFHRAARRVPANTHRGERKARLSACREGKMPSPPGPVHAERKSDSPPGGCAAGTPRQGSASGHAQRRALGARASCPRYAPQGALVREWIRTCAPDGASEGKMPSPPGARRRCRARSCAGLASSQGTRPSAVGKAVPSLQPATCSRRGPWGEGILPSLAPQGAFRPTPTAAKGKHACRRAGKARCLPPQGPSARKEVRHSLPGGCAAETPRQGSASGHGQRRALGARASCSRYAPQGALLRKTEYDMRA